MSAGRDAVVTATALISADIGPEATPRDLTSFDASGMPIQTGYPVTQKLPMREFLRRRKDLKLMSRDTRLGVAAAGRALVKLGVDPHDGSTWPVSPQEVGLFMGVGLEPGDVHDVTGALAASRDGATIELSKLAARGLDLIPPLSALKTLPNMALAHVAINFGCMGPSEAVSPWATSGITALAYAVEAIERGECDMALVGAADSETDHNGVTNLVRLGLGPSDGGAGFLPGEGAAFLVLEARDVAESRGASALGTVRVAETRRGPQETFADYRVGRLAELLERHGDLALELASGVAGHHGFEQAERAAAEAAGWRIHARAEFGWAGAATALMNLVAELEAPGQTSVGALGWAPSGEHGIAVVERGQRHS